MKFIIRDYKVTSLPTKGVPNAKYYLSTDNGVEEYITDIDGNFKRVQGPINISAGTTSSNVTELIFSNSNNVSFGLSSNVITASIAGGGGAAGTISAGTSSMALGEVIFSNSNNISFGLDGSTLTASVSVPNDYISSNQSSLFEQKSHTSVFLTNQSTQPVAASGSNGSFLFSTLSFGNSNGFSFYTTNGSIVGSYTDNGGGGGDGFNRISAGTQLANASTTVYFSNDNNVSFGMAGNSVVTASASYSNPTDYISTAQSSLFQLTSDMSNYQTTGNYLTTAMQSNASSDFRFTSNDSELQFTSQMSDYLDTNYTTHTHGYILTNNSSLFQLTADNSLSLGTGYTTHTHSQYLNTSQSSLFEQSSHTTIFLTNQSTQPVAASASNGSFNFSTLKFVESNGVTWATSTDGIRASVETNYQSPGAYLTTAMLSNAGSNFVNTSAGLNLTNISATLNSNSVSLSVAAQTTQPVAYSASNGSALFSTLKFVETNGVTWATSTDGIRASVKTDYQTSGNYLTTAMASNRGSDFVQATAAFAGTNATGTIASDGISVSVLAQSVVPQNASLYALGNTTQNSSTALSVNALSFNAIGSLTVGYSNGSIQLSAANALTSQTVQTQSNVQGLILSNTTYRTGDVSFRDGNGISWASTTGQGISITHGLQFTSNTSAITSNALNTSQSSLFQHTSATSVITSNAVNTGDARIRAIAASDATYTSGSVTFRDLNGITWQSTTGQQIQITHGLQYTSNTSAITSNALNTSQSSLFQHTSATSAITSAAVHTSAARIQGIIGSNTTYTSGSVGLRDLNGITWQSTTGQSFQITHDLQYTSNTSAITSNAFATSASSRFVQNWKLTGNTAGTTSSAQGTDLWFQGGNNLTISGSSNSLVFSVGNYLTTARASTDAIGLNTAQSNVTWTANSSGLSLDARGYAGTGTSATNASVTLNSNGLQISVAAPGAAAENNNINLLGANTAGNTTASGSTIGWSGINLTLSGTNNSVVNISAPATSSLSATGQVSISVNGSTISIGVPNAAPRNFYNVYEDLVMVGGQVGQGTLNLNPNVFPAVTFDRVYLPIFNSNATNSSGSHTLSFWLGIYTSTGSTLSLLTSQSTTTAVTHSGTAGSYSLYSGIRHFSMPISTSLSEGRYYIGILSRTTSGGANGTYSQILASNLNSNFVGQFGSSHNTTYQFQPGIGVYSTTLSSIPSSIGFSQLRGSDSAAFRPPNIVFANSTI